MHLKSLTLRGFKSFAAPTTLRFEPGITAVVGPNGSGKSNVVDAIAWVLGEQGAKSLRGGKMEDVIFAGTSARGPLGRAEVELTLDNADGALPIEYAEVSISRLMYRSGESEYAINGSPCRLLDIQELLSDSGIGREMHVVVGQGQLDAVLQARPEDRRAFIEEAAGVLKHRKRKEKALRKLDAMQVNLTRLTDLTAELRRQLKPLGRQAEVARRAAVVQADLRDARLRLLADDLVGIRDQLSGDDDALRERRAEVEREIAAAQDRQAALERAAAAAAPELARAQDTWYRLSSLQERLRGLAGLAAERTRHLTAEPAPATPARDPDALEAQAADLRGEHAALAAGIERHRATLEQAVAERERLEAELGAAEERYAAATRAAADRREGLARLAGDVAAVRSRVAAAEREIGRLTAAHGAARERAAAAAARFAALEGDIAALQDGEENLDERHERAAAELSAAEDEVARLQAAEADAERRRAGLLARRDALAENLARQDGSGALLEGGRGLAGLLGPVAGLIEVEPAAEVAIATALGAAVDAVAVASVDAATDALRVLRDAAAGRTSLLVAGGPAPDSGPAPAGARAAIDLVRAPAELRPALARLLHHVAVVDSLEDARRLVGAHPDWRAVTRDGDLLGRDWAVGGASGPPSRLQLQAGLDETEAALTDVGHELDRLRFALAAAAERTAAAHRDADAALTELHDSDARMAAVAEELGQLGAAVRAAGAEADRLLATRTDAELARERDLAELAELEQRLLAAEQAPDEPPDSADRDLLAEECRLARGSEVDARLHLRTAEERADALAARAAELSAAAAAERAARETAAVDLARRQRAGEVAAAVGRACAVVLRHIDRSLGRAAGERVAIEAEQGRRDAELTELRGRLRELAAELERLTDAVHRDEVLRAEQRLREAQLLERAVDEFGTDADTLLAEYGPDVPVPPPADAEADAQPRAYDRAEQERRARSAERALALLGKVNPLALEEFAALEERHAFLSTQLEDLRNTRRDLLTVVKEVDERVEQVFAAAFADTAREFETVFATLFPGGEGRLVLTDPNDLLTTGVEVEARPPGKKVRRLSLLSGGERALTAVALLVAIFRARPSPFYILDEVEAALDDRNLSRLLDLLVELRATSQLVVITHQKRTMEIADALYGVSMRGDGLSVVVSQRLRERDTA